MNCPSYEVLSAFADGAAPPAETSLLERHIPECRSCDAELRGIRAMKSALAGLPVAPAPVGLLEDLAELGRPSPRPAAWAGWAPPSAFQPRRAPLGGAPLRWRPSCPRV